MNQLEEIAHKLHQAEITKMPIPPIRTAFPNEKNIDAAYEIQKLNTERKLKNGAKIIGKKIGLTSFAVQEQLGVDEPDFGILTDKMLIKNFSKLDNKHLMQPKAETEWAFVLKEDLDQDHLDLKTIKKAIDYALVAIEIVGSRIENWDIKITDTVADNASASHFVLGTTPIQLQDIDLENCKMQLFKNEILASLGQGKACMGNPLNAMLWLAQTMQKHQQPLKAGEIIITGALGPMVPIEKGDVLKTCIDDFEEVGFQVN